MTKLLLLGYGHCGISFLRDFLAEVENNYVFPYEFWLTTFSGGLFDIENTIEANSIALDDPTIRRFFKLVDYLYRCSKDGRYSSLFNEEFVNISNEFASKLIITKANCDTMWCAMHEQLKFPKLKYIPKFLRKDISNLIYNPVRELNNDYGMYFLNTMSVEEYYKLAKDYLKKIYNLLPQKEFLTLVHPMMISGKFDNQLKYFDDEDKLIRICRDPRDVYVNLLRDIKDCTVATSVENFITYFKKRHINDEFNTQHYGNRILDIYFEDLVLNYNETEKKVLEFCGIPLSKHTHRKEKANPEQSIKNVGLYKNFEDQNAIKLIEKELSQYCYNNNNVVMLQVRGGGDSDSVILKAA